MRPDNKFMYLCRRARETSYHFRKLAKCLAGTLDGVNQVHTYTPDYTTTNTFELRSEPYNGIEGERVIYNGAPYTIAATEASYIEPLPWAETVTVMSASSEQSLSW